MRFVVRDGFILTVLALLAAAAPAPAQDETTGSFWYAIDNVTNIQDGARALVWVTLPPDWHGQTVEAGDIVPEPENVYDDPVSGNKVVEWIWEPEAWELLPGTEPRHFFFHYEFTLTPKPVRNDFDPARVEDFDRQSELYRTYTQPDTWLQTEGPVRDMAQRIAGRESNPGLQARLLYRWVLENLTFVPGGEGQRDAASVLQGRRGDCGQFSNLYTAFCRSLGIPARNVSLVWLDGGLHDISEIFLPGFGWFPVDTAVGQMLMPGFKAFGAQEVAAFLAARNVPAGDPDYLFGNLPDFRMAVTRGVNVRFDSVALARQVNLQRMRPGGVDAFPEGFLLEGFNKDVVHGGFFVFGDEVPDDEQAHALTHQRLASLFFHEGLNDMTLDGCRESLEKYLDGLQSWINLGKVYMHKGEFYKAEAVLKRAIGSAGSDGPGADPTVLWAHNFLGNCYDMLGQRSMAEAEYRAVADRGENFRGAVDYAKKYLERPFSRDLRTD